MGNFFSASVSIYQSDIDDAANDGIITKEAAQKLFPYFQQKSDERWRMSWVHLAYGLGAFLIIGSMTWFTSIAWEDSSGLGLFLLSSAYVLAFGVGGYKIWYNQSFPQLVGGVFVFISVCISPVMAYSLQRFFNYWPNSTPGILEECTVILFGCLSLYFVPFSLLTAPIFLAAYIMSQVDLANLIFGPMPTVEEHCWVSIVVGLVMLLIAFFLDRQNLKQDYAMFAYFFGATAAWGGLTTLYLYPIYTSTAFKWIYFLINLSIMPITIYNSRFIFVVYGGLGSGYVLANYFYVYSSIKKDAFISIFFGSILSASAWYVSQKNTPSVYPFWAYLFGITMFWNGWAVLYGYPIYDGLPFGFLFFFINCALLIAVIWTKQEVFVFWGTIGVFWFVGDLAYTYFWNSYWSPFILTLLGLLFIGLAIYFSTHHLKRWRNQSKQNQKMMDDPELNLPLLVAYSPSESINQVDGYYFVPYQPTTQ